MRPLNNPVVKQAAVAMQAAIKSGNDKKLNDAWEQFYDAVTDTLRQDFEMASGDQKVLADRGFRMLTAKENKFYQEWIDSAKSPDPKQAFTDLLNGGMPETIIEDVYKNLVNDHPLLDAITFTNVSYLTKWIMNDHTVQTAGWGQINAEITKEISSSFKILELTQCKLTCYATLPKDMLELGPVFLDNYIRTILIEALACGLENAIVSGTGKNMPIGLDRNISKDAAVVDGKYPQKTAVKIESFLPAEYGKILASVAKTENGHYRKFTEVGLVCNPVDYFKKIMPATTVMNTMGTYEHNVFPFPTKVYPSAEIAEGKGILFVPEEYFMGLGSPKEGSLTYDDSVQFLEDNRLNDGYMEVYHKKEKVTNFKNPSANKTEEELELIVALAYSEEGQREQDYEFAEARERSLNLKTRTLIYEGITNDDIVKINGSFYSIIKTDTDKKNRVMYFYLEEAGDIA